MSISVNEIRKDFPLLENQKVIYLDTAATSQKQVCAVLQPLFPRSARLWIMVRKSVCQAEWNRWDLLQRSCMIP